MEPGKARIRKWNRRHDETNRCGVCASWFGWMQRYHSIYCCGAGCPPFTTGGDNEDTPSQSSLMCTRDTDAWTMIHQQETMIQHPHAVADYGRKQHRTATDLRDLIRPISSPRFKSGIFWTSSQSYQSRRDSTAWNTMDDQTVETTRVLHGVRATRGILRHPVSEISDVDPHGTIGGHPACIATTGATRDEGQEEIFWRLSEYAAKPYREATGEPRGRRRRTIAIIHRLRSGREATL